MVILTNREKEIIEKKINYKSLTPNESNILSKAIRKKLNEVSRINAQELLKKIKYNQKSISIENKIKNIVLDNLKEVQAIILYGSAVQTNYDSYNDIDVLIVTKSKIYKSDMEKYKKIKQLQDILKENSIIADIGIISLAGLINDSKYSPTLIYQLKDHKIIYGNIKIPDKIEVYKIDLQMKLDYSNIPEYKLEGNEVYSFLRNVILVRLLMNKIVDNTQLKQSLYDCLGKELIEKLKNNKQSNIEMKYSLNYLRNLVEDTRIKLKEGSWEKIKL